MGALSKVTPAEQKAKSALLECVAEAYSLSGLCKHLHKGKVLILAYHRVLTEKELDQYFVQPGMYVHVDVFEQQMRFLKKHFVVLSFAELLELWSEGKISKNQRYCVITFDDGWIDNYLYAYPILRRYNMLATVFLASAFIGTDRWFWSDEVGNLLKNLYTSNLTQEKTAQVNHIITKYPWLESFAKGNDICKIDRTIELCKALPEQEVSAIIETLKTALGSQFRDERMFLNWEEIEEMSNSGVSFGSHSSTHRILTKHPVETVQKELTDSLRNLKSRKLNLVPVFCYPNGDYNPGIAEQVRCAGYRAAVTIRSGLESTSCRRLYDLHRISIHNDISRSTPLFEFHISGLRQAIGRSTTE